MNRQFVFGVDLDGVCGDYIAALKPFVAKELGLDPDDLTDEVTWNCPEWGITKEEYEDMHARALKEQRLFLHMPTYPEVSEALWELSDQGVWIRIITHRLFLSGSHALVASDTVQWLDNVKIPYRDICFIGGKQEVGADLYIEDNPANIDALRAYDKSVIVFDQPYNRHTSGPRVTNWQQAKEIALETLTQYKRFHTPLPGMEDVR